MRRPCLRGSCRSSRAPVDGCGSRSLVGHTSTDERTGPRGRCGSPARRRRAGDPPQRRLIASLVAALRQRRCRCGACSTCTKEPSLTTRTRSLDDFTRARPGTTPKSVLAWTAAFRRRPTCSSGRGPGTAGLDRQRGELAVAARAVVPGSILPLLEHQRLNPFRPMLPRRSRRARGRRSYRCREVTHWGTRHLAGGQTGSSQGCVYPRPRLSELGRLQEVGGTWHHRGDADGSQLSSDRRHACGSRRRRSSVLCRRATLARRPPCRLHRGR
jgi:hypothetical protein